VTSIVRHQPRAADVTDNAKKLLTLPDFCQRYGVGRTRAYDLMRAGAVTAVKVGRSTRITTESAERWLANLPVGLSAPLPQRRRRKRGL
jgi:predicted DNA-binding transcriptional regulator AlpA